MAERAIGYEIDSEEIRVVNGKIVRVPVRKHFPPDISACILWLKNRMPHKYKEHVEEHHAVVQLRGQALAYIYFEATFPNLCAYRAD